MFGSSSKNVSNDEPTVIGRGTVIQGTVRVQGRVQVDGEIEGTLEANGPVSVGPHGRINGELIGEDIAVGGVVEGQCTARKHLHVVSSGKVHGDVRYDTLQVDRGAVLDGRTLHNEDDAKGVKKSVKGDDPSAAAAAPPKRPEAARPPKAPSPVGAT